MISQVLPGKVHWSTNMKFKMFLDKALLLDSSFGLFRGRGGDKLWFHFPILVIEVLCSDASSSNGFSLFIYMFCKALTLLFNTRNNTKSGICIMWREFHIFVGGFLGYFSAILPIYCKIIGWSFIDLLSSGFQLTQVQVLMVHSHLMLSKC